MTFEGKTDRELYIEMRRVSEELVRRYEQYLDLFLEDDVERRAAADKVSTIQFTERTFRGFYERCRDLRETIEDAHRDWDAFQRRRLSEDF